MSEPQINEAVIALRNMRTLIDALNDDQVGRIEQMLLKEELEKKGGESDLMKALKNLIALGQSALDTLVDAWKSNDLVSLTRLGNQHKASLEWAYVRVISLALSFIGPPAVKPLIIAMKKIEEDTIQFTVYSREHPSKENYENFHIRAQIMGLMKKNCIDTFRNMGPSAVNILIDEIPSEPQIIGKALEDITGKKFIFGKYSQEKWRNWWAQNKKM